MEQRQWTCCTTPIQTSHNFLSPTRQAGKGKTILPFLEMPDILKRLMMSEKKWTRRKHTGSGWKAELCVGLAITVQEGHFSILQELAAVICGVFLGCQFSQADIYITCGGLVNVTFRVILPASN